MYACDIVHLPVIMYVSDITHKAYEMFGSNWGLQMDPNFLWGGMCPCGSSNASMWACVCVCVISQVYVLHMWVILRNISVLAWNCQVDYPGKSQMIGITTSLNW